MGFIPEQYKIVQGLTPVIGTAGAMPSDVISLKNVQMAWILVNFHALAAALALIPHRCTTVAKGDDVVLANVVPIWVNDDTGTTDTAVRVAADAVNYTTTADGNPKQIIFQIDPANLGETAGGVTYDCIYITTGAVPNTDYINVDFILEYRYAQATPPTAITD